MNKLVGLIALVVIGIVSCQIHVPLAGQLNKQAQNSNLKAMSGQHTVQFINWYVEVLIGTPGYPDGGRGKNFQLEMNTMSSNIWVPNTRCTTDKCASLPLYNHRKSSTYVANGTKWQVQYQNGQTLDGYLSQDKWQLGVPCQGCFTPETGITVAYNQTFTEVTDLQAGEIGNIEGGRIGLGFPAFAIDGVQPIHYNMWKQGVIPNPSFGVWMRGAIDNKGPFQPTKDGQITFGGVDSTKFTGSFQHHKISTTSGAWTLNIQNFTLNHPNAQPFKGNFGFHVSAAMFSIPYDNAQQFNENILGCTLINYNGIWRCPCNSISTMPDLDITIDRVKYVVPANLYIQNVDMLFENVCISSIVGVPAPMPAIGNIFYHKYYAQFSPLNETISFANAVQADSYEMTNDELNKYWRNEINRN